MRLKKYFESRQGTGVLATSNKSGRVDVAVYSSPHILGRNKIAFVMKDRLSHRNIKANPKAAYLFTLKGSRTSGLRLYLTMTGEERDQDKVLEFRRRSKPLKKGEKLYLAYFRVTKVRALIGDKEYKLT